MITASVLPMVKVKGLLSPLIVPVVVPKPLKVLPLAAVDDGADATAHNLRGAVGAASQTAGMSSGGRYLARHVQVADKGVLKEAEWGDVIVATVVVEGQRVTAAVEDSAEGLRVIACGTRSHHCRDADVGIELEVRVAVAKTDP